MLCGLQTAPALAAERGTLRQDTVLMSAPYRDATTAGDLKQNTTVTIQERRGAWLRVRSDAKDAKDGWVRLHLVRIGEGAEKKTATGESLGMLWSVGQTGRSGAQGVVATTGIRGFDAEALRTAKPNPQAVQSMDGFSANSDSATAHARSVGLKAQQVEFLPNPTE
ncbi:MAG: hypothetical protein JSW09_09975 [Pseudomonadota bacterium]|nr:MAG: hypothetical protein JSW09_09975 [Pseudomonadota bacterium]